MNYNVLDEKWIPVLYHDGRWDRVGIRKALEDAGRIRQVVASNPMDRVAILRFLLALLYWCKGSPPDGGFADAASFPADWFSRLSDSDEHFDLLGDAKRFYQDGAAQRTRAVTDLIQEIPTGNNFWHFRHATDEIDGLCLACCTIGLLRLPLFSVSGLPDLKAGINGTPPVYVVPVGSSLLETMIVNWIPCRAIGKPAWVEPYIPRNSVEQVPILAGLTMLSRRVWLHEPKSRGTCVGCGSRNVHVVRTCEFQTAGKQQNDLWTDPHVVYLNKMPRKAMKAPDLSAAGRFRMDRPWPDLFARMAEIGRFGPQRKARSFLVVGFATDQAKNIDVWEQSIAVQPTNSVQETAASLLSRWRKEGWRMEKRTGRSDVEGAAVIAAVRPDVEGRVSAQAHDLIAGDGEAWQQAAHQYRPMMIAISKSLSPGFTAAAVQRRRHIAHVLPDMLIKPEENKKSKAKKGGDK